MGKNKDLADKTESTAHVVPMNEICNHGLIK